MDKQENDQHAYKETTLNDEDHEVFPKGPLGPILGAPKQYEPPRQDGPRSRGGNRLNPHGQILNNDDMTIKPGANKAVC